MSSHALPNWIGSAASPECPASENNVHIDAATWAPQNPQAALQNMRVRAPQKETRTLAATGALYGRELFQAVHEKPNEIAQLGSSRMGTLELRKSAGTFTLGVYKCIRCKVFAGRG